MKNKIAILVINFETPELVENLVKQIRTFDPKRYDLTVIDNSYLKVYAECNEHNEHNLGFDQTVLRWLKENRNRYAGYWLLNSDCELDITKDYLARFLELVSLNKVAMVTTKVEDNLPGAVSPQRTSQKGIFKCKYTDFQSAVLTNGFVEAFLNDLNHKVLNYFHGGLDLDCCLFAQRLEWDIIIDSTMKVTHYTGQSTKVKVPIKDFTNFLVDNLGDSELISVYKTDEDKFNIGNAELLSLTLVKRYPHIKTHENNFQSAVAAKNKLLTSPLVDIGIAGFIKGVELFNKLEFDNAIPLFKIAAMSGNDQAYAYLASCYDNTGRFSEGADFFRSFVNFDKYDGYRSRYEYLSAQRDTYEKNEKESKLIVFYVKPDAGHRWDSAHTEQGIGGSEIAVIQLSKELAALGHTVYVFNNCVTSETYDNVTWKRLEEFDRFEKSHDIDILLVSRLPEFRFVNPKTKVYFWAHDLNYYNRLNAINMQYFDKFLVLSRYHYRFFKAAYPFIPTDRIDIFANGLDLSRFNQKVDRIPTKLIYSSNPDRGMTELIPIFEELKKWDSRLELHVFGYYPDNIRKHPDYWKETPGLIYRGYHNQQELAREYMSSVLWLYPCTWLETFCITAIEAQAAGTPSVVSDWGCLRERVGNAGIIVDGWIKNQDHRTRFIEAVKMLLTEPDTWREFQKAGYEQVKHMTWKNCAQRFIDIGKTI